VVGLESGAPELLRAGKGEIAWLLD